MRNKNGDKKARSWLSDLGDRNPHSPKFWKGMDLETKEKGAELEVPRERYHV
jgi:hypothetical protein